MTNQEKQPIILASIKRAIAWVIGITVSNYVLIVILGIVIMSYGDRAKEDREKMNKKLDAIMTTYNIKVSD